MKTLSVSALLCFSLTFFFFSGQLAHVSGSEKCHPTDKKVLFQIKQALHNPYILNSWTHDTDCCDWNIVLCEEITNRVSALVIQRGEVNGHIPAAVGDLPYLTELWFHKLTNLTGTIPSAITKLTRLRYFSISWTNLSGPVPSFLSQLESLEFLDLSYNDLTGSIPASLSRLPKLSFLRLDRNKLTGSIPEDFRMQGARPYLRLGKNHLSGKIPAGLAKTDFYVIELFRNMLEGDASFLFGKNKSVTTIDLNRNMLEFDLSKVKELPPNLDTLDLSHNNISGSLPAQLSKLPVLQFLNASYNHLCGKIPVGGNLDRFGKYEYLHNKCLCGPPLPACKK